MAAVFEHVTYEGGVNVPAESGSETFEVEPYPFQRFELHPCLLSSLCMGLICDAFSLYSESELGF